LTGWTAVNQRVDLGSTQIVGCTPADTSTYLPNVENQDNNAPSSVGTYATGVLTTGDPPESQFALQLESTGITTAAGLYVVHGPAVYSSPFEASAGDSISFDWRAFAGADAYHVFGYIIDDSCGNQTELLDAVGVDASGSTDWATAQTVLPASGSYRFVFVAGTYDFTGFMGAGARLLIDNVRVIGSVVSDDAAQQIARRLRYANTSDAPPASQAVTVTARNVDGNTGSDQITVNITGVDDEPTFDAVTPATLTNTDAADDFSNQTGTLSATDPDNDPISYDVVGGEAASETIGGTAYTRARVGTYGTLYVNDNTGAYMYVPDDDAINARSIGDDTDGFTLTATAAGVTRQRTYTVTIDVTESAPGTPTDLEAAPASRRVALSWDAPSWLGGSRSPGTRWRSRSTMVLRGQMPSRPRGHRRRHTR
jgi:hypothetical protein